MSKGMQEINWNTDTQRLLRLVDFQDDFLKRYTRCIPEGVDRDYFVRDFLHLINLIYREAQEPLVKQMTEFLMTNTRPFVMPMPEVKP